jgi:hypothetical protein
MIFLVNLVCGVFIAGFPITFAILGFIAFAYYNDFRHHKELRVSRIRIFWGIILFQFSVSVVMLLIATKYWETSQALWVIESAFWLQIFAGFLSIVISIGFRLFAVSVNVLTLLIALMCWLVCAMAITGVWI